MTHTEKAEELIEKQTWLDLFRKYEPGITEEKATYILWNETCYPFCDEITLRQIEHLYNP